MIRSTWCCVWLCATVGCVVGSADSSAPSESADHKSGGNSIANDTAFANPSGQAATFSTTGSVDLGSPFFQSFGTNGRTCGTCHDPSTGWTITPGAVQQRFAATGGTDPIFALVDGAVSPTADVSTVAARQQAYAMLLAKGLIRIGIGIPANAEFSLVAVDDPYGFASAQQLSLFRRPLPSTNLPLLTAVMWDGRETLAGGDHCNHSDEGGACFASVDPADLEDQANGATLGHAQAQFPLTSSQQAAIAQFEASLYTAQVWDNGAHDLTDARHAMGGPDALAAQATYYGINDNLGDYQTGAPFSAVIFTEYSAWRGAPGGGVEAARAAIARGEDIFNSRPITISGVGGLNAGGPFNPPLPASFTGTCGTCHDTPHAGDHSIAAPLDIGLVDASQRTPDLPLYTLRNNTTGETRQVTDPGRALITGKWADIGKFKGPVLRGLAARAPYFHNGSAQTLADVVDFYDSRFQIGFTAQEKADLIAFLQSL
ncbi:MAG TPA: hypothetical protein VLX92_04050 [Kofleriaceae bacterium]|nr:hypothetical protein [Kofleriaceae bacterium]